ncbi:phage baseplate plug family protein [Swingsia samuiensis]|uniref:Cyanophage baseplate Pam3 plug gp18 domain-containing protein n=1 Tax=Swingsia samuiensis TaxID=1293412 RepID=A0A4Y6UK10_9PROT|nr:hypothetical protein [Swingsia samuiensis]QDH17404.1 hypothetical protein E3D00_07375 [Swingsia samuiensis]
MIQIPLIPTPSQTMNVVLNQQSYRLDLYQRSTGLYLNLWRNSAMIVSGALCQNKNPIIHASYLGIGGDLLFIDTLGNDDPRYDGLGSRFILVFIAAGEKQ